MPYFTSVTHDSSVRVTSPFGYRLDPFGSGKTVYHGGMDFVLTTPTIYAPASGTVVRAWVWQGGTQGNNSWGNHTIVQMSKYDYYLIAHMSTQPHHVGQAITAGQVFGTMGATGNVTGAHVHIERWTGGFSTSYRTDPSGLVGWPNAVGTYQVVWAGGGQNPDPPSPGPDPGPIPQPTPTTYYYVGFSPEPGTYDLPIDVSMSILTASYTSSATVALIADLRIVQSIDFSPEPGTYDTSTYISMSSSISGEIWWVDDGNYPDSPGKTPYRYSGPFTLPQGNTQITAAVFRNGVRVSDYAYAYYVIQASVEPGPGPDPPTSETYTIYYTVDGTYPTRGNPSRIRYTGPVHITKGDWQFIALVEADNAKIESPYSYARYKILNDEEPEGKDKRKFPIYMMIPGCVQIYIKR